MERERERRRELCGGKVLGGKGGGKRSYRTENGWCAGWRERARHDVLLLSIYQHQQLLSFTFEKKRKNHIS